MGTSVKFTVTMGLKGSVLIFLGEMVVSKGLPLVTTIYCGDSQTVRPDAQRDIPKYFSFFLSILSKGY